MQTNQQAQLKAWLNTYTRSFLTGETLTDSPLMRKIAHTARGCDNIRHLGCPVHLTGENRMG